MDDDAMNSQFKALEEFQVAAPLRSLRIFFAAFVVKGLTFACIVQKS